MRDARVYAAFDRNYTMNTLIPAEVFAGAAQLILAFFAVVTTFITFLFTARV